MGINYSTIITKEELELISTDDYQKIRLICEKKIKESPSIPYFYNTTQDNAEIKAYEFTFRNKIFSDIPYCKKIMITTNLLYFNNDIIINILLSKNITYKVLSNIINKIGRIKHLALMKDEYELDEKTTISDKNLNTLCKLIKRYYFFDDYNLIIAKLVEIVVFQKELYLSLEGGHQKKHFLPTIK